MKHFKVVMTCCCCLVFTQTATAQMFTGVSANIKTQPIEEVPGFPIDCTMELGLDVCNVFAEFDDVFPNVKMISVTMSTIQAEGLFYQDTFGNGNIAPQCNLIPVFPSLQCDTFVTMNRKNNCAGVDMTTPDPSFAFGENATGSTVTGGWFNGNPANDQGHPQPTGTPGLNQVLIAQFSVPSGGNVSGMLEISWQAPDGGLVQFNTAPFACIPDGGCPCEMDPGLCAPAGACTGGEVCSNDPADCPDPGAGDTGCVALPDPPASTMCEADGDLCTGEHCDGLGNCIPFPAGDVVCQDPVPPCEGGEQCDPATGECIALPDAAASTDCELDGDLCTGEHCDGQGNCIDFPAGDVICQDPVPPCEGGEACEPATGECIPLPDAAASTDCELDGDLCTGEHCDGAGACVDFPAGDVICQDPVPPCEGGEACEPATGECIPLPDAAASTDCELDGDLCTNDHCDGAGACVFLSDVMCQDPAPPCEGGEQCNPSTGQCDPLPDAPLSTGCDNDGDLCSGDHCDGAGNCVDFPDGDVMCQDPVPPCEGGEICDPATGGCVAQPDAAASTMCEADGDLCTNDHCDGAGACVFLSDVMCQDPAPPCEGGEQCNPSTGQCDPLPDAALSTTCDNDGDLCTGDHCDGQGNCVDFPDGDVMCQDPAPPCEGGETCDPATGGCVPQPDAPASTMCEADGDLCTNDHCDGAGSCVFLSDVMCQDANPPCEGGEVCDPGTGDCVAQPDAAASTMCEADGDLCTNDHCDGNGACVFLSDVICQDANPPCEGGELCDPMTGQCVPQPDAPMSTDCDTDGDLCTGDHCDGAGNCVDFPAGDVMCQGPNPPCEAGQECNPTTGQCDDLPDAPLSTMCEADGDLCTDDHCDGAGMCILLNPVECPPGEVCEDGICVPAPDCTMPGPDDPACDDENDCTDDLCTVDLTCVNTPVADGILCGDPSDTQCDDPDSCLMGVCVPNNEAVSTMCDNDGDLCTGDHCDGMGNCADFPAGDVICADPVPPCEGGEQCNPSSGQCEPLPDAPMSTTCDNDGDLCTGDHCDGAGNCVDYPDGDVICQDPNPPCEGGEQCSPMTGECVALPDAPDSTMCELDGNLCTNDHCDGIGNCVFLSDVICQDPNPPCEGGSECDPGTGMCVDLPDAAMSTDCELDGDQCTGEHCDGAGSCVDYPEGDVICPPGEECNPANGMCVPVVEGDAFLDIKPGSCPNPVNTNSNGVIPVAVVGTASFDVTQIDLSTVTIQRADGVGGSAAPNEGPPGPHSVFDDVATPFLGELCGCHELEGDGITDLSMKFRTNTVVEALELDDVGGGSFLELCVSGLLLDGTPFSACDCITIRPPGLALPSNVKVESNAPGTFIEMAPVDLLVDGDGFTNFNRFYDDGSQLTLTAPLVSADGLNFVYWVVNGVAQPLGQRTIDLTVHGRLYFDAVYRPGQVLQPESLPVGFQRPDGSFGSDGTP